MNAHARTLVEAPEPPVLIEDAVPPRSTAAPAAEVPPAAVVAPAAVRAEGRMLHVDGLRAIAALVVALFHFRGYVVPLAQALPQAVDGAVQLGYLGVNLFFVLSGFVIAHSLGQSLRDQPATLGFVGRFALRRQLRLDPPYWMVLALAAASLSRTPGLDPVRLAPTTLLAHVAYVQNILGLPNVLDVFWTLCIEVQLYLAFALLMVLMARIGDTALRRDLVLAVTTLASVLLCQVPMPDRIGAWFAWYWYMFALGVWARAALDRKVALLWLLTFSSLAVWRAVRYQGPAPIVCVATAWTLVAAAKWRPLARALSVKPLLLLGTISYSFYLLHALAGAAAITTVLERHEATVARCALAVCAGLAASIAGSAALYLAVERPAMGWSRRIALRPGRAS